MYILPYVSCIFILVLSFVKHEEAGRACIYGRGVSFSLYRGTCIYYSSYRTTSWNSAKSTCATYSATLVKVTDSAMNAYLRQKMRYSYGNVWLGLNDLHREGTYVWQDGSRPNYTNWASGQPNNYRGREDCVCMVTAGNWYDSKCTDRKRYFCQRPPAMQCSPLPGPPYTRIRGSSNVENATKYYTCQDGYVLLSGDANRTCLSSGNWSGTPPVCDRLNCTDPGIWDNSNRTGSFEFGRTLTYTCADGYFRSAGDWSLLCKADGTWDGVPPNCSRINCGDPGDIRYGTKEGNYSYQDTVWYTCNPGYQLTEGDSSITCNKCGMWQGKIPTCERISCGKPDPVKNATAIGGRLFGDTATYWCLPGFYGDPKKVTCREDGSWVGTKPICKRASSGGTSLRQKAAKIGSKWYIIVVVIAVVLLVGAGAAVFWWLRQRRIKLPVGTPAMEPIYEETM